MRARGGFRIGDQVVLVNDRGELVQGVFKGTDALLGCVEVDAVNAALLGRSKAGEAWVSMRRLRAKDGAQTANT